MMSTLAKMEISITEQVRAKRDAMTFTMVNDGNSHTVQQLREKLSDFASFFPYTAWGGGGTGIFRSYSAGTRCGLSQTTTTLTAIASKIPNLSTRRSRQI